MSRVPYPKIARVVQDRFWVLIGAGRPIAAAAAAVGVSQRQGYTWFGQRGGVKPSKITARSGRYLQLAEREEIAVGLAAGLGVRELARRLGRAPSTISREITRNAGVNRPRAYRGVNAQAKADARAARPKPGKIASSPALRAAVQAGLSARWSPQQITRRLRAEHPHDERMRISHETIYQALYVQGRGLLRRDLAACLRTGRAVRRPRHRREGRGRIPDKVMISERPAEVADRAVPGHWEGDLIIGRNGASAIGTLVERTTRYVLLLHLPARHGAAEVADAMAATILTLPAQLRRTLTWDQGSEMHQHTQITLRTGMPVYFCDPASPWQRGSNENTNGLLRQYFPKGTDLSIHSRAHLDTVAAELNARPRATLNWATPAEALNALLCTPPTATVATTS